MTSHDPVCPINTLTWGELHDGSATLNESKRLPYCTSIGPGAIYLIDMTHITVIRPGAISLYWYDTTVSTIQYKNLCTGTVREINTEGREMTYGTAPHAFIYLLFILTVWPPGKRAFGWGPNAYCISSPHAHILPFHMPLKNHCRNLRAHFQRKNFLDVNMLLKNHYRNLRTHILEESFP